MQKSLTSARDYVNYRGITMRIRNIFEGKKAKTRSKSSCTAIITADVYFVETAL
jgi:hypothetical protein